MLKKMYRNVPIGLIPQPCLPALLPIAFIPSLPPSFPPSLSRKEEEEEEGKNRFQGQPFHFSNGPLCHELREGAREGAREERRERV